MSLAGAQDKLDQIEATVRKNTTATQLGMPSFGQIVGRAPNGETSQAVASRRDSKR